MPPIFTQFKKLSEHRINHLAIQPQPSGNRLGCDWDRLLGYVIEVDESAVCCVLKEREMGGVFEIVAGVEGVVVHISRLEV